MCGFRAQRIDAIRSLQTPVDGSDDSYRSVVTRDFAVVLGEQLAERLRPCTWAKRSISSHCPVARLRSFGGRRDGRPHALVLATGVRVVTGVSAGALVAPMRFLGPKWEGA